MNTIQLLYDYITLPKAHKSKVKLTGTGLFCGEYANKQQYVDIKNLFIKHSAAPIVRMPFPWDTRIEFYRYLTLMKSAGLRLLVLFDCFYSDKSMEQRINELKAYHPDTIYFELFNELPRCKYPGQQISGLNELINLTNTYAGSIRRAFPKAKILSMAPANMLAEMEYSEAWGNDNINQIRRLARETRTDIISAHLYMSSWRNKARFKQFRDIIEELVKETNKSLWITETGADGWDDHVEIFEEWTSRFKEYLPEGEIIWYRQAAQSCTAPDAGFALHHLNVNMKSPLCERLIK